MVRFVSWIVNCRACSMFFLFEPVEYDRGGSMSKVLFELRIVSLCFSYPRCHARCLLDTNIEIGDDANNFVQTNLLVKSEFVLMECVRERDFHCEEWSLRFWVVSQVTRLVKALSAAGPGSALDRPKSDLFPLRFHCFRRVSSCQPHNIILQP